VDQSELEEILESTGFRELLDKAAVDEVEARLNRWNLRLQAKHADGIHDPLLNGAISRPSKSAHECTGRCLYA
jgi:hypothetical protein